MEYKQSMNLVSPSGYAMPFELSETTPLEITLGYGKQTLTSARLPSPNT